MSSQDGYIQIELIFGHRLPMHQENSAIGMYVCTYFLEVVIMKISWM